MTPHTGGAGTPDTAYHCSPAPGAARLGVDQRISADEDAHGAEAPLRRTMGGRGGVGGGQAGSGHTAPRASRTHRGTALPGAQPLSQHPHLRAHRTFWKDSWLLCLSGVGRARSPERPARGRPRAPSPFQRGDAFVPAGGPPRGEAGAGLPGAVPVPGVLLSLPPALGVPAVVGLCPGGEGGNLEAVIKDAESKVPVALRQREQGLVHVLRRGGP